MRVAMRSSFGNVSIIRVSIAVGQSIAWLWWRFKRWIVLSRYGLQVGEGRRMQVVEECLRSGRRGGRCRLEKSIGEVVGQECHGAGRKYPQHFYNSCQKLQTTTLSSYLASRILWSFITCLFWLCFFSFKIFKFFVWRSEAFGVCRRCVIFQNWKWHNLK